jgi:hypothetical protein
MQFFKGLDSSKMDYTNFFESIGEYSKNVVKKNMHTGGLVVEDGPANLAKGELVLSKKNADIFLGAVQMLEGSRNMERNNGGPPIVVNNNNIDASQTNSSSQATTFRIPESVRSGEPTMATAIAAYAS